METLLWYQEKINIRPHESVERNTNYSFYGLK